MKSRLDGGEPVVFVDARSADAWLSSDVQIPDSIRIPPDQISGFDGTIAPDATVVTYCT